MFTLQPTAEEYRQWLDDTTPEYRYDFLGDIVVPAVLSFIFDSQKTLWGLFCDKFNEPGELDTYVRLLLDHPCNSNRQSKLLRQYLASFRVDREEHPLFFDGSLGKYTPVAGNEYEYAKACLREFSYTNFNVSNYVTTYIIYLAVVCADNTLLNHLQSIRNNYERASVFDNIYHTTIRIISDNPEYSHHCLYVDGLQRTVNVDVVNIDYTTASFVVEKTYSTPISELQ